MASTVVKVTCMFLMLLSSGLCTSTVDLSIFTESLMDLNVNHLQPEEPDSQNVVKKRGYIEVSCSIYQESIMGFLNFSKLELKWSLPNQKLLQEKRAFVKQESPEKVTLTITAFKTEQDAGNYTCRVWTDDVDTGFQRTMVIPALDGSPILACHATCEQNEKKACQVLENVNVECSIWSFPQSSVRCQFDQCEVLEECPNVNVSIKSPPRDKSVYSTKSVIAASDMTTVSGKYTCKAVNYKGKTETVLFVPVSFGAMKHNALKHDFSVIKKQRRLHSSKKVLLGKMYPRLYDPGDKITIGCFTDAKEKHLEWFFTEVSRPKCVRKLHNDTFPGTHIINRVSKVGQVSQVIIENYSYRHIGRYFCKIKEETSLDFTLLTHRWSPEANMDLNQHVIKYAGSSHVFNCTSDTIPLLPKITWRKGGVAFSVSGSPNRKLSHHKQKLHLKNLKPEDSGLYLCNSVIKFGREEKNLYGSTILEVREEEYDQPLEVTEEEYALPQITTDGEYALTKETTEGEYALTKETTEGEYALPQETTEGEYALPQETTEGGYALPKGTTEGEYALPKETTEGEYALPQETTKGEYVISQEASEGEYATLQEKSEREYVKHQEAPEGEYATPQEGPEVKYASPQKAITGEYAPHQKSQEEYATPQEAPKGKYPPPPKVTKGDYAPRQEAREEENATLEVSGEEYGPPQEATVDYVPPKEIPQEEYGLPQEVTDYVPPKEIPQEEYGLPQEATEGNYVPPKEIPLEEHGPPQEATEGDYVPPQEISQEEYGPPQEATEGDYVPPHEISQEEYGPPQEATEGDLVPPQEISQEEYGVPQETTEGDDVPPQIIPEGDYVPLQEVPEDVYVPEEGNASALEVSEEGNAHSTESRDGVSDSPREDLNNGSAQSTSTEVSKKNGAPKQEETYILKRILTSLETVMDSLEKFAKKLRLLPMMRKDEEKKKYVY